ncbi:pituitary adenylate cyclase-activating polypeptide type I receptor-like isoform X2 [Harpegnathos saltator]|uniref:pituitary adenylate cyclase-activating polypeptide type I receptor-like isoform X2 n=1 Tax=Harpegnathos saltator TaxID=610380 RepID=UPI000DBEECD3|nr:pituitary adenylate cyclase-activating polypeptide type I receptor-like isoform X2 [Harpegnathos saltator]
MEQSHDVPERAKSEPSRASLVLLKLRRFCLYNPLQICRVLYVLFHYFLLTNYAWMFCEGFYLRTLLVNAFTNEHKLVNWLMGLGWSMPTVIVTLYTALRASSNDPADTEQACVWRYLSAFATGSVAR